MNCVKVQMSFVDVRNGHEERCSAANETCAVAFCAWAELHQIELTADWNSLQEGKTPRPIEPLK